MKRAAFLKAANLHYQVGDTVQNIVELRKPKAKPSILWKPLSGLAAAAACFCLVFFGYYQPNYTAYGTLRIQINPDVEMTVSRTDRVLDLEGLNDDGEDLIEGYAYRGKDRETAANELVERAIDMGYLSDGDTISITVNSAGRRLAGPRGSADSGTAGGAVWGDHRDPAGERVRPRGHAATERSAGSRHPSDAANISRR